MLVGMSWCLRFMLDHMTPQSMPDGVAQMADQIPLQVIVLLLLVAKSIRSDPADPQWQKRLRGVPDTPHRFSWRRSSLVGSAAVRISYIMDIAPT